MPVHIYSLILLVIGFLLVVLALSSLSEVNLQPSDSLLSENPVQSGGISVRIASNLLLIFVVSSTIAMTVAAVYVFRNKRLLAALAVASGISLVVAFLIPGFVLFELLSSDVNSSYQIAFPESLTPTVIAAISVWGFSLLVLALIRDRNPLATAAYIALWIAAIGLFFPFLGEIFGGASNDDQREARRIALIIGRPGDVGDTSVVAADGSIITQLENGGETISSDAGITLTPGFSADREGNPGRLPVFKVSKAPRTGYLRSATGDVYQNHAWGQTTESMIRMSAHESIFVNIESSAVQGLADSRELMFGPFQEFIAGNATDRILLRTVVADREFGAGVVPTPTLLQTVDLPGQYGKRSRVFVSDTNYSIVQMLSPVRIFDEEMLVLGSVIGAREFLQVPPNLRTKISPLTQQITQDATTDFQKALALEDFLRTEFRYEYGSPIKKSSEVDPVEEFLFNSKKGTAGNFSSSFVLMARSVGLPARIVSGWAIAPQIKEQIVYTNQAHQWAEIAFKGLGWVRFDPTPTEGAPIRTSSGRSSRQWLRPSNDLPVLEQHSLTEDGEPIKFGSQEDFMIASGIDPSTPLGVYVFGQLGEGGGFSGDEFAQIPDSYEPFQQEISLEDFENLTDEQKQLMLLAAGAAAYGAGVAYNHLTGETLFDTEAGGAIGLDDLNNLTGQPSTTAQRAKEPIRHPLFSVSGSNGVGYLRTAIGETYAGGVWLPAGPNMGLNVQPNQQFDYRDVSGNTLVPPYDQRFSEDLIWVSPPAGTSVSSSQITIGSAIPGISIDSRIPTPNRMSTSATAGTYSVPSMTFATVARPNNVTMTSERLAFSGGGIYQVSSAPSREYTQLPDDIDQRIAAKANEIVAGVSSDYERALRISDYLMAEYRYAFSSSGSGAAQSTGDPVSTFLFDEAIGTCGNFSSAFVLMARSVGLASRVVAGWAIAPVAGQQTVYSDQAHQWAEVAFEDYGWVEFDPTPNGGNERSDVEVSSRDSLRTYEKPLPTPTASPVPTSAPVPTATPDPDTKATPEPTEVPIPTATPPGSSDLILTELEVMASLLIAVGDSVNLSADPIDSDGMVNTSISNVFYSWQAGSCGSLEQGSSRTPTFTAVLYPCIGQISVFANQGAGPNIPATALNIDVQVVEPTSTPGPGTGTPGPGTGTSVPVATQVVQVETTTTINEQPSSISRGGKGHVLGSVTAADGSSVTGPNITIHLNDVSPDDPLDVKLDGAWEIGTGVVTNGAFDVEITFPLTLPLGSYQIIAVMVANADYLQSDSDPPIVVVSGTNLTLSSEEEVVVGEPFTVIGTLVDDAFEPLSGVDVEMTLSDGNSIVVTTGLLGEFEREFVLTGPGAANISASYAGTDVFLESTVTIGVVAKSPSRIEILSPSSVIVGASEVIVVRLLDDADQPIISRVVSGTVGSIELESFASTAQNDVNHIFQEVGNHLIRLEFEGDDRYVASQAEFPISVVSPTTTFITEIIDLFIGDVATVIGQVTANGTPDLTTLDVEILINGASVGTVNPSGGGDFSIDLADSTSVGVYTVEAKVQSQDFILGSSMTRSFEVFQTTTIELTGPVSGFSGQSVQIDGTLLGSDGTSLGNFDIQLSGTNSASAIVTTGVDGTFFTEVVLGEGPIQEIFAAFEGLNQIGGSSSRTSIDVVQPEIVIAHSAPVLIGESYNVSGRVIEDGVAASGRTVDLLWPGVTNQSVDTDSLGEFDFTIPIDISALLGTRNFTIQVPENGAQITSEIAVISGTTLRITAVEEAALGDEVIFSFTVVDDADRTVSGVSILIEGLAEPVTTDDLGAAVATLVVPVDTIAPLWRVSAETVATEQYLASEASYSVAIQKALAMWVYIVFAVVGLVGTAGGAAGFWLWRKMRPTTVTEVVQVIAQTNDVIVVEQDVDNSDPVVQTESVKSAVPDQEEIPVFETSLLSIDLVNDNEEFPEIIGIGEVISLRIVLDNTENTFIVGATVSITVGGHGEFSEVTGDSGLISLDLEAIATGDHVVKVSFEGSDDYLASTANTRIWVIDYREAITDVYNRLVARVRASGLELNSQATPREIERRVVTQIPGVDEVVLDRLVSVFEEADYSLHDISRSDFLKAHVALQSLSAFFDQLREQAALLEERSSGELDRDAGIEDEIENISPSSDDSEVEDEETERGKDADDEGSIGS